ncbi:hypothetical protein L843_2289 [Mycobacterium intracellulare MIN_061107_1834]|nr:hypothetical protein L843_2289 [Mycobacterium intracellulare MIN_061107_1834]
MRRCDRWLKGRERRGMRRYWRGWGAGVGGGAPRACAGWRFGWGPADRARRAAGVPVRRGRARAGKSAAGRAGDRRW